MSEPAARDQHVRDVLERLFRQWAVRAVPVGAVVFLLVAPLDFISVPDLAGRFLSYRIAAAVGLILLWYPISRTRSPLALRAWIIGGVVLGAVTVEVMILSQGGSRSAYGYGMVLLAVTVLGLIPASVGFHALVSGAIYATFLVPLLLWGEPAPFRDFFTQNYLFVSILAVTIFMRHLHRRSLEREIGLAFDLHAKERDLETQVAERTDALVHAAAEWRATFDSVGDAILMIDRSGHIVRANAAAAALARQGVQQVPGTPASALLRRAGLDAALGPLRVVQRSGERSTAEVRHYPSLRWFVATAEPIPEDREQPGGAVLTLRDVTDVKLMERAVIEARDEWEETFDNIQEGITIHDDNHRVLRANAAARRLLGCADDPLEGNRCFELFHGLAQPIGGCPGCEAFRTGLPTTVDLNEPHLGRYLEITALPRRGGGITHVVHDVSERKIAMDELTRAAERLQGILGHAPFGVFIVNEEFRVEFANPAMTAISGYPREQFVGAFLGGFPGCLELGMAPHVQGALEGAPFRIGPAAYHCRGGRTVVGQFTGIPIEEDGQRKALVFVEDITSLATAEQERHRLDALLQHAQKMESIGTLASGIAHDFNNILLAVIGLTDAAAERLPQEHPARLDLDSVIGAAERGSELVHQLLAFGRRQELRMRPLDLRRLVAETRAMLVHVLPKTIAIDFVGDSGPPPVVVADAAQIGQVLMNLAVNARDAMPEGGRLSIGTGAAVVVGDDASHPGVAPGCYAVISVRDCGSGMSKEVLARIFDPFFTTKEPGQGTGLGLATVYGIVSQHGGTVRVESSPGAGSAFYVYLPAAPGTAPADSSPARGGTEAVLLVEDDPMARQVIGRRLSDLGYRVVLAVDGEEAIRLLEQRAIRPDLLLCDVVLPGVGARQVAAVARALAPAIRVVFMSGHPESQLAQSGLLGPGDLLLAKSLGPEEITRRLRDVLDRPVVE